MGVLGEQAERRKRPMQIRPWECFQMLSLLILCLTALTVIMPLGLSPRLVSIAEASTGSGHTMTDDTAHALPQLSQTAQGSPQTLLHPVASVQLVQHSPKESRSTLPSPVPTEPHTPGVQTLPSPAPVQPGENAPGPTGPHMPAPTSPALPHPEGESTVEPGQAPAPGEHAEHKTALPEISPIPGVTFVETMIRLMEDELEGRTLGWRPNDIFFGQFTDNINYYQLGVLEALRFTTLRLKDSLTRMGDADTYDPDLEQALNLFMNKATLFWFPSAERSYGEAVDHLKNFLVKLRQGERSFYYRKDNLLSLISVYKDLLGNVNRNLTTAGVSWFKADEHFYYAKGVAHVYYEILRVTRVGFQNQLASTLYGLDIMDTIIHELHTVEQLDPWIVLDSDLDGFFANHRANLNAPLSEVVHMLVVLSQL